MGRTGRERDVEAGKKVSETEIVQAEYKPYFAPEVCSVYGELSKWDIGTNE